MRDRDGPRLVLMDARVALDAATKDTPDCAHVMSAKNFE
jgi:hypothetical protein